VNHFRGGSTRIPKTQANSPNWTLGSHLKEQTLEKSSTNHPHTDQRIKTPVRKEEKHSMRLGSDPRPSL